MEPPAITTQPLSSSQNKNPSETELPAEGAATLLTKNNGHVGEKENDAIKEQIPESNMEESALYNTDIDTEKENEKKRRQEQRFQDEELASDCCCVYAGSSDPFVIQMLCHWVCDCFRCIGECTESCFEDCATCLGNCCEDGDGCDCGDGNDDCMSGCLECCTACDCDCNS